MGKEGVLPFLGRVEIRLTDRKLDTLWYIF